MLVLPGVVPAAHADDYPSWADVQAAQGNEQATQEQVTRISDALASTQAQAAAASRTALDTARAADSARADADAAAARADSLGAQARTAAQAVTEARARVGALAASRERAESAAPLAVRLLTSGDPDELLLRLGAMQKLDETWQTIGQQALQSASIAASLQAQAADAEKARRDLSAAADQKAAAAKDAADREAAAVADLQGRVATLYDQLAVLKNTTADVERRYRIGQEIAEQERQRKLEEEQKRQQEQNSGGGSSGGGGWTGGGDVVVDPGSAQAYARGQLGNYGWSGDQFGCLLNLWNQESSWRADALNPDSGAYGIPQALPAEKLAAAGPDWRTNGNTQIDWGLGYIADRYGSPCGAWSHEIAYNWY